jgi:hypothetical protein
VAQFTQLRAVDPIAVQKRSDPETDLTLIDPVVTAKALYIINQSSQRAFYKQS